MDDKNTNPFDSINPELFKAAFESAKASLWTLFESTHNTDAHEA